MNYLQPLSAPFSPDSIELADRFAQMLLKEMTGPRTSRERDSFRAMNIMDLCCGCGVVGLEAERRFQSRLNLITNSILPKPLVIEGRPRKWTFLEVQEEYQNYFELNRTKLGLESSEWIHMNYGDISSRLDFQGRFDWIVSNPPYFEPIQGRLPPNQLKARSRFFLDGSFEDLLRAIQWALTPGGKALILVRGLDDHGIERDHLIRKLFSQGSYHLEWLDPIRGTNLLLISHRDK